MISPARAVGPFQPIFGFVLEAAAVIAAEAPARCRMAGELESRNVFLAEADGYDSVGTVSVGFQAKVCQEMQRYGGDHHVLITSLILNLHLEVEIPIWRDWVVCENGSPG